MEKHLFNLKFTAKSLLRESKKAEKAEKSEKLKVKKAIAKGDQEVARIHAENAIRQKNNAVNFLRMSARIDAVAARVQTAVTMKQVSGSMAGVVKSMSQAVSSMNLEKMSMVMDKFERQFEDLDVQTQVMDASMSGTTAQSMPESQVDGLMQQVADEHGLEFDMEMDKHGAPVGTTSTAVVEQDDLTARLAKLRENN
eukprot:Nk52_evm5s2578 gene=Nk52_evmTU5s2578